MEEKLNEIDNEEFNINNYITQERKKQMELNPRIYNLENDRLEKLKIEFKNLKKNKKIEIIKQYYLLYLEECFNKIIIIKDKHFHEFQINEFKKYIDIIEIDLKNYFKNIYFKCKDIDFNFIENINFIIAKFNEFLFNFYEIINTLTFTIPSLAENMIKPIFKEFSLENNSKILKIGLELEIKVEEPIKMDEDTLLEISNSKYCDGYQREDVINILMNEYKCDLNTSRKIYNKTENLYNFENKNINEISDQNSNIISDQSSNIISDQNLNNNLDEEILLQIASQIYFNNESNVVNVLTNQYFVPIDIAIIINNKLNEFYKN